MPKNSIIEAGCPPEQWLQHLFSNDWELRLDHANHHRVSPQWFTQIRRVPFQILWFVGENEVEGRVNGKTVILSPGTLFQLSPGVEHEFRNADPRRPVFLSSIRFHLWKKGRIMGLDQSMIIQKNAWEARPWFQLVHEDFLLKQAFQTVRIRSLLGLIFTSLFREGNSLGHVGNSLNRVQRQWIAQFVERQGKGRITPEMLARQVRLSKVYFTRIFQRTYGVSPREWLVRERIRKGAQLLQETALNVTEVADHLGYQDIYLFSRQFRAVMGCSPRKWRQSN